MSAKKKKKSVQTGFEWEKVVKIIQYSRAIDRKEESELVPEKKVLYQFTARGHELGQVLMGSLLTHPKDAASAYYRSRPLLLSLGLSLEDAMAAPMGKSGGYSDGRDIGVVCNKPDGKGAVVLPMAGDVGSQYTPAAGWAQAIEYRRKVLKEDEYKGAISVVFGGDGSVATNGFWSALTMATTLNLPVLFFIEDNNYGISVPSHFQTPGGNIANNLRSFKNLNIKDGDGTDPDETAGLIKESVDYVRSGKGPLLLRLIVPRLSGHSYQDNQAYKDPELIEKEENEDPLDKLYAYLVPEFISKTSWKRLETRCKNEIDKVAENAWNRPDPDLSRVKKFAFAEYDEKGEHEKPITGGLAAEDIRLPAGTEEAKPEKQRINIVEAIRRTLETELEVNDRLLVFGEDVGAKGGVHAATLGLQSKFGEGRVFDTSLSEEGIIGRAVGMAYAGLMPVAEIQFRKYADSATEQIKNCGTIRWRTANRFAAPIVVRMPGGFAKCGDPWHSESNEAFFAHIVGWQVVYPSNAEDVTGLLRSAMRSNNPTIFFEHRNMLDAKWARRSYPGDDFVVPFGKGKILREGKKITVVTWGAMCERAEQAAEESGVDAEIIDLRSIIPWDKEIIKKSVKKTNRCLIVHEDQQTAGFGSEIASYISDELFEFLDAPVQRLTTPDIPVPYNVKLMNSILPGTESISAKLKELTYF